MKTILVPTDFSENAYRAIKYACNLALQTNSKIILMNAYQSPASASNVMINFIDILEEDSKKGLAEDLSKILENDLFSSIEIKLFTCYGYLSEAIKKAESKFKVDLVVMGTTGATNLSNRLFGSNTTDAIRNSTHPILVIPNRAVYTNWKNITFALNVQSSKNDCSLSQLSELMIETDYKLNIVTVVEEVSTINKLIIAKRIEPKLKGVNFEINVVENSSVTDGVLDYINSNNTDLLVLIRKNYGFIEGILHRSVTKKLALHSSKPMLLYSACN